MDNDLAGSGKNSHESKFRFDVIRLATYQTSLFLNANDLELFQFRMSITEHFELMDNDLAGSARNSHESKFRFDVIRLATYQTSLFLNSNDLELFQFRMSIPEHSGLMDNGLAGSGRNSHESKFRFDMIGPATYQTSLFLNANYLELFQFGMSIPEHSGLMNNGLAGSGRNSHESKFRFDVIRLAAYQTSLFFNANDSELFQFGMPIETFQVDGQ